MLFQQGAWNSPLRPVFPFKRKCSDHLSAFLARGHEADRHCSRCAQRAVARASSRLSDSSDGEPQIQSLPNRALVNSHCSPLKALSPAPVISPLPSERDSVTGTSPSWIDPGSADVNTQPNGAVECCSAAKSVAGIRGDVRNRILTFFFQIEHETVGYNRVIG